MAGRAHKRLQQQLGAAQPALAESESDESSVVESRAPQRAAFDLLGLLTDDEASRRSIWHSLLAISRSWLSLCAVADLYGVQAASAEEEQPSSPEAPRPLPPPAAAAGQPGKKKAAAAAKKKRQAAANKKKKGGQQEDSEGSEAGAEAAAVKRDEEDLDSILRELNLLVRPWSQRSACLHCWHAWTLMYPLCMKQAVPPCLLALTNFIPLTSLCFFA
jgi:hypothetical protein